MDSTHFICSNDSSHNSSKLNMCKYIHSSRASCVGSIQENVDLNVYVYSYREMLNPTTSSATIYSSTYVFVNT